MKKLLIGLIGLVSISTFAGDSCAKVVVNANTVYFPADLGKERICSLNVSWVQTTLGHYSDLGITNWSSSVSLEKVGSFTCEKSQKVYILLNIDVTDSEGNNFVKVYAVSKNDIMM